LRNSCCYKLVSCIKLSRYKVAYVHCETNEVADSFTKFGLAHKFNVVPNFSSLALLAD